MTDMGRPARPTRRPANTTITDVAVHAGVSIKTVSRVLNGEPNVRPEKRDRVMAAVEALSYRPNASARSLAAGRSYLIGLFYENPNIHYVGSLQHGALTRCSQLGYHLVVEECAVGAVETAERVEEMARQTRLDGAILSAPVCDDAGILSALDRAGIPMVRLAPRTDPLRTASVSIDDRQAAYDLTMHLIRLGHRRIGFITGHPDHRAALWREQGFRRAMADARLPVDPALVRAGDFTFASGLSAADGLLGCEAPPTAIFAANDDMAAAVMAVALRRGVHIPADLSVAGFDGTPVAERLWPELTTVYQPLAEMAAAAVGLIAGGRTSTLEQEERTLRLDYRVILRESTAAPRTG